MRKKGGKFTAGLPIIKLAAMISPIILAIESCEWVQIKKNDTEQVVNKPIARVQDKFLYKQDIEGIAPKGTNPADSANMVYRYIQNWIKKQLMIAEASNSIEFDRAEIERKILDYRYALMAYEFEKKHVFMNLDKEVTDKEIGEYYLKNKDNFPLKQNIVRCVFLQVPKESPKLKDITKAISGNSESAKSQLKSLSLRYATKTHLEDTIWLKFDDVFQSVPLAIEDQARFLKENKGKLIEAADQEYVYLVNIRDFKTEGEISPLEYINEDIETIIINKRKIALARQLEEDIYNKALKNKNFEIYVQK